VVTSIFQLDYSHIDTHLLLFKCAQSLTMAEIFGAVASGAGLVSLSMQLLESAQKLKGFYDSAKDAPETLWRLYYDLETMALTLRQVEHDRQNDIVGNELIRRCMMTCERAVMSIKKMVNKVDRIIHKARFLGRVYMGFKEPEVKRLLQEMEYAKSSMSLAYMTYAQYVIASLARERSKMLTRCEDHHSTGDRLQRMLPHIPYKINDWSVYKTASTR
jgi:hypothetical protein